MNHKLLLSAAMLMAALYPAQAQETIYTQDFEAGHEAIFAEGWKIIGFNGTIENNGVYSSSTSIAAAGFAGKTIGGASFAIVNGMPSHIQDADSATQSPAIELPAGVETLSFRTGSVNISGNANSHYSIYAIEEADVLVTEGNEELKELLDSTEPLDEATIGGASSVFTANLSAFAEKTVVLFFRLHETTGNNLLLFDDITITSGTMGTENPLEAQFSAYPNPVADVLNINSTGSQLIESIKVYNTAGQLVATKIFRAAVESYNLNMADMPSGLYLVKMVSGKDIAVKRVMKS